jgi:hypothetical protein
MKKRLKLATRAFGAEPGMPDIAALAAWIGTHRGTAADIITYFLDQSLAPQVSAEILTACAGGRFYKNRIMRCLSGIEDGKVTDEVSLDAQKVREDAEKIVFQKKSAWCAVPAPHLLGIADTYYGDSAEWNDAISVVYRGLMRSMRDAGISGHVLICQDLLEPEILALAHQKVFFFQPAPDRTGLEYLLERQVQVAVNRSQLDLVLDLTGEYDIRTIILMDPDEESIAHALSCMDPDQLAAGGYCTEMCDNYWTNLVDTAVYRKG